MGGIARLDKQYKPLHIFVLDPLEFVALGLKLGEEKMKKCIKDKWNHPDPQKTACVAHGAIIYTATFPERTHKDHRPPEAWLHEAGITEAMLHQALKHLELDDPQWEAKREIRRQVNEMADKSYEVTNVH